MLSTYGVRVLKRLPHPGRGFTQGLLAEDGVITESVGQYRQSELRRYALHAGRRAAAGVERAPLAPQYFAEGICRVGDIIWQLTWKELTALAWDAKSLTLRRQVRFNREGWGMCAVTPPGEVAAAEVVTSAGTSELVRRDPRTLEPRTIVQVRCEGARVRGLNDLTWSGGRIWANVAGTSCLAGIDLDSGEVTAVADAGAAAEVHRGDAQAIMNGIAAGAAPGEFLLTGKSWRWIRLVRLVPGRGRDHVRRLLSGIPA